MPDETAGLALSDISTPVKNQVDPLIYKSIYLPYSLISDCLDPLPMARRAPYVRAILTRAEDLEVSPAVRSRSNARKLPPSRYQYRNILLKFLEILPVYSGKFCPFCKAHRTLPMNLHREDCAWRLAEELVDSDEPG
jgi:hypothetical protein